MTTTLPGATDAPITGTSVPAEPRFPDTAAMERTRSRVTETAHIRGAAAIKTRAMRIRAVATRGRALRADHRAPAKARRRGLSDGKEIPADRVVPADSGAG